MISHIYIVVENGEAYQHAYSTYECASNVVKTKYKDIIDEDLKNSKEYGCNPCCDVDIEENQETGITKLYIEKEIYITIYKVMVKE
jgi:hypothetical protein